MIASMFARASAPGFLFALADCTSVTPLVVQDPSARIEIESLVAFQAASLNSKCGVGYATFAAVAPVSQPARSALA